MMFHISILKQYKGDAPKVNNEWPEHLLDAEPILSPAKILQRRILRTDKKETPQLLIQWNGTLPTWEDKSYVTQTFPEFNIEDDVSSDGVGIDMNEAEHGKGNGVPRQRIPSHKYPANEYVLK